MLDCVIIGDSIAVGTKAVYQECALVGRGGINTWQFNKENPNPLNGGIVVISLGTNDHRGVKTEKELLAVRNRVTASRVYWILPQCNSKFCKPEVNEIVHNIADKNGDVIVSTNRVSADLIHPSTAGYKEIVSKIKNGR